MKSPIRWAGGKRQLLPILRELVPDLSTGTYHEPFLGSGALFFDLLEKRPPFKALLSDTNQMLIRLYEEIQQGPDRLIEHLSTFQDNQETFLDVRERLNRLGAQWTTAEQAAMFLYLNKTCFNGLYRENAKGQINTPYGYRTKDGKGPVICDSKHLQALHQVLDIKRIRFRCCGFDTAAFNAEPGDFVYFDPPYLQMNGKGFVSYSNTPFNYVAHENLAIACQSLDRRGVKFLASNADVPAVHDLYCGFTIEKVQARRSINSNGQGRGRVGEVLIRNY